MSDNQIGLDNPAFVGRYKQFGRGSYMPNQSTTAAARIVSDMKFTDNQSEIEPEYVNTSELEPAQISTDNIKQTGFARITKPPVSRVTKSQVIQRNIAARPQVVVSKQPFFTTRRVLVGMAIVVFLAGLGTALFGFRSDRNVQAQPRPGRLQDQ